MDTVEAQGGNLKQLWEDVENLCKQEEVSAAELPYRLSEILSASEQSEENKFAPADLETVSTTDIDFYNKTNIALMHAYAFRGDKDHVLKFYYEVSKTVKLSDFVPNLLAAFMYSEMPEASFNDLFKDKKICQHVKACPTIWLNDFSQKDDNGKLVKRNLAEVAAWCNRPKVLDALLKAGLKMPKPKIYNRARNKLSEKSIKDYFALKENTPIPPTTLFGYSEEVEGVLCKHVIWQYLRTKGQTVDDKERYTWLMWIKSVWMSVKAWFGFGLTQYKVDAAKRIDGMMKTSGLFNYSAHKLFNDNLVRQYTNRCYCVFNEEQSGDSRGELSLPDNQNKLSKARHLSLLKRHHRRSEFSALLDNSCCVVRGASSPRGRGASA